VQVRSGFKAGVHAVLAKQGLHLQVKDLFGPRGRAELAAAPLDRAYRARVNAYLRLVDALDVEIGLADGWIAARLTGHEGYRAIQAIPGVGPVWAAVFVAEIGDVSRFASARHLCSWAGLTPRHRESDTTVHRGPITKQGSTLIRWAAVEAVQRIPVTAGWLVAPRAQISARRGRNIATVAVARRLLTLVYYGRRDGHIRALRSPERNRERSDGSDTAGAA
jgi:transposase